MLTLISTNINGIEIDRNIKLLKYDTSSQLNHNILLCILMLFNIVNNVNTYLPGSVSSTICPACDHNSTINTTYGCIYPSFAEKHVYTRAVERCRDSVIACDGLVVFTNDTIQEVLDQL